MEERPESILYRKFERIMVAALTLMLAIIVVAAVLHLAVKVIHDVLFTSFDPTQPAVFQDLFGAIFTVLMALEFKRSILVAPEGDGGVVRVKIVILIGLLAIVRKVIILDLGTAPAVQIIGLSAALLALGIVYWLMRDHDRCHEKA